MNFFDIEKKFEFFKMIGYVPSPQQAEIHRSPARFLIWAAGARAGKSMAAGAEGAYLLFQPGKRIWIVSTEYQLAEKEFNWITEFLGRSSFEGKNLLKLGNLKSPQRGSKKLRFPWGSFVETKSTKEPSSLLGEELDMIIMAEASQIPRTAWERQLRARIGPRNGRLIAFSTPNSDSGLFLDLYKNGQSTLPDYEDWASYQSTTMANPFFSQLEYDTARKELDPKIFAEQYAGEFISRRGRVFNLDPSHIYTDAPAGIERWPVIRSVVRAYQNPLVILCTALEPGTRDYWVYHEIHRRGENIKGLQSIIAEPTKGRNTMFNMADYRDHSAIEDLRAIGIRPTMLTENKYNKTTATIRRVQALIAAIMSGKVHVHKSCVGLLNDLQECTWPEAKKEGSQKLEEELPLPKYLQGPLSLSLAVAVVEQSRGINIYAAQAKEESKNDDESAYTNNS